MSNNEEVFVRRFVEMFNQFDMSIANEIFVPHFKAHLPLAPAVLDRSGFKSFMLGIYDAFPNLMLKLEDTIPSADRLVLRVTYTGTHKGEFIGLPPTGNKICVSAIYIFHMEGGLAVENWMVVDFLEVITQISGGAPLPKADCA
jgi:predicted ester cyclase